MNKSKFFVTTLLYTLGITGIFGFNTAFGMSLFGREEVKEPLNEFEYHCGGGMLGGHKSLMVKRLENGLAIIEDYQQTWHHAIPTVSEYMVSDKILEEIKQIFNEKEMVTWEKRPPSEIQILDGDTSSYYFNFAKRRIRFSDTQSLPDKWWDGPKQMMKQIAQYCEQGEKLPGLVVPPRNEDEPINYPKNGKVSLSMYYYRNNYLSFYVNNGTDKEQKVNCSYSITQLSPETKEIIRKLEEGVMQLSPNYSNETGFRLRERLGTGRYMLKFGDYSVEFEVK